MLEKKEHIRGRKKIMRNTTISVIKPKFSKISEIRRKISLDFLDFS
jgi:hypothetical protein